MLQTWTPLPADVVDDGDDRPADVCTPDERPLDKLVINDRYEVYRRPSITRPEMDEYTILHFQDGQIVLIDRRTHVRSAVIDAMMVDHYGTGSAS